MNRSSYPRRYDLDALRATAMLLGIVLHAGLSFTPFPWAVQDTQQSDFFGLLFAAIHGFRMPVFFVLSGFFTAMLWRGREWLVLSPVRFFYLIPLTMIPQSLMGLVVPSFGPDTSFGLLPMPHILLYYALFFLFGALYFDCDDPDGRVGKWWWLGLPVGLFIVFPLGLEFSVGAFGFRQEIFDPAMARSAAVALQVIYAWMMTFGFIGLFRKLCTRENNTIRYLSDSSYWLYVAHVPLVIGAQLAVRDWPLSSGIKYFLVLLAVTGLLLLIYQFLVRYTWLGKLLNGPRVRPTS